MTFYKKKMVEGFSIKNVALVFLILYLASMAMLLKSSDMFFYLLFFLSLFRIDSFYKGFLEDTFFRYISISIWLIFLLVLTSTLFSQNLSYLFTYRFEVFNKIVLFPFIFHMFKSLELNLKDLTWVILLAGLYSVFYVIVVFIEAPSRGVGLLSGAIHRGSLAVIYSLLALALFLQLTDYKAKIIALLVFLFGFILSMQTGSKGGWLAFLLVFSSGALFSYYTSRKIFKYYLITSFMMIALLILTWDVLPIGYRLDSAYRGYLDYVNGIRVDGSVGARLEIWKAAIYGIQSSDWSEIIFGHGFMTFEHFYIEYVNAGLSKISMIFPHPHNDYLKIMFEFGLLGVFIFSLIFILPAVYLFRIINSYGSGALLYAFPGFVLIEMMLEFMLTDKVIFVKYLLNSYLIIIVLFIFALQQSLLKRPISGQSYDK